MNKLSKLFLVSLLISVISTKADARMAYIPAQLEQFEKTGICVGCDLSEASFYSHSHDNANLTNSLLVKADFTYAHFYTSNFSNAQMMYANFYEFKASGSDFSSANLTGVNFRNANLSSCNFTGAILNQADLSYADLARANISENQLASAKSLSCAIMPDGTKHASDPETHC